MMETYGVYIAIFLLMAPATFGRPTEDPEQEEMRMLRKEIELLRAERPCQARLLEVRSDIKETNDIKGDPHYVPECTDDGKKWRAAQCDHHDSGACFCVHEENGEIMEHTRDLRLHKEALKCGLRMAEFQDHSGHMCFHMKDEFTHMQKEYGLQGHSPLPYYPDCTKDGKFVAMQRNDMSEFFCVDSESGEIIPDTKITAGSMPPLTLYICQAYDEVWQDFKQWNASQEQAMTEQVTKESCGDGFTFTKCGCPRICTSDSESNEEKSCICQPACVCPNGQWELEGKCVSLEECHEAKPKTNVLFSKMLKTLTGGKFDRWQQYRKLNPNIVLERYNSDSVAPQEEYGGPESVAFDVDPGAIAFFNEGPPPEEGSQNQSAPTEEDSPIMQHVGAEPIPGDDKPFLLEVFEGDLSPSEIAAIIETGTRPGHTTSGGEDSSAGFNPTVETYNSEETEAESSEEDREETATTTNDSDTVAPFYYYYYEDEEHGYYPTHNEGESEMTGESELKFNNEAEREENSQEENEAGLEESDEPERSESENTEISNEEERSEQSSNDEESSEESQETNSEEEREETSSRDGSYWRYFRPEGAQEDDNTVATSPDTEEDNKPRDELYAHQQSLTSVPVAPNDVQRDHSTTPPCEEVENLSETPAAEQEALEIINRVLGENEVIDATLEKETPSVKKSIQT